MKHIFLVVGVSIVSLLIFWAPFIFRIPTLGGINFGTGGMQTIVQNFDGLNFLIVAKSLYNPTVINEINAQFMTGNSPLYFSAHYPLFALIIKFFSLFTSLPTALLLSILVSNVFLSYALYLFFEAISGKNKVAVALSVIALFFPARMLSVRAVGSNEPLFIALTLLSLIYAYRRTHVYAALLGSLAVLTRSPGILLFGAYALTALYKRSFKEYLPYLLMPITLLGLFAFYGWRYGNPLAYFQSGDNIHLFLAPFQIFSNTQSWVDGMWREDVIYLYLFYGAGLLMATTKSLITTLYSYIYGAVLLFVAHRDLGRYALPLAPLVLIGYAPFVENVKKLWWIGLVALVPIYLLGWQFVTSNVQPINDWGVFISSSSSR